MHQPVSFRFLTTSISMKSIMGSSTGSPQHFNHHLDVYGAGRRPNACTLCSAVSLASLLGTYIFLELGKELRVVLSSGYRFFILVSRDPSLVKRNQLLIPCLGHDLPTLFLAVGAA